jgi:hypothetical protein
MVLMTHFAEGYERLDLRVYEKAKFSAACSVGSLDSPAFLHSREGEITFSPF